jgi:copper homeostasis protein
MKTLIETAAFTVTSAIKAAQGGADRIELCSGYAEGGLSPSTGAILVAMEKLNIPVNIMIRPRVGDFVYNGEELLVMEKEIRFCRNQGVNGVVLGILTREGEIDKENVQKFVDIARPMAVTFHRAFDLCPNPFQALKDLISCGVHRVLTSGSRATAPEGIETIAELVKQAGDRIIILPGGGITAKNVMEIVVRTGVKEVHLSGKALVESPMINRMGRISLSAPGEVWDNLWFECEPQKIRDVKSLLDV